MAINKNALIRYQVLDRCFRNPGRNYFWEDLLREVNEALINYNGLDSGIRRRQLYNDITFMESEEGWSVPLERHRDGERIRVLSPEEVQAELAQKLRAALKGYP
jgi:hypothetical protein